MSEINSGDAGGEGATPESRQELKPRNLRADNEGYLTEEVDPVVAKEMLTVMHEQVDDADPQIRRLARILRRVRAG
jgi:hypothetical protein